MVDGAITLGRREKILSGLNLSGLDGVEIGPLAWPLVRKHEGNVIYVDFADAEFLKNKYRDSGTVPLEQIVEVDAIWGANTLQQAIGERSVDYIIASHVIEHVPDLLGWLSELSAILKPDGQIRLAIPDRRFSFDYLRRETSLADILSAYLVKARVPQPVQIFDFVLNYVDVDKNAAWEDSFDPELLQRKNTFEDARPLAEKSLQGEYIDVHCWVFTPRTFAQLFAELANQRLIDMECTSFFDTAPGEYEFFVTLKKSNDQKEIVESWEMVRSSLKNVTVDTPQLHMQKKQPQQEIDMLLHTIASQKKELELRKLEAKILETRISDIFSSRSWRITKPLRAMANIVKARMI